MPLTLTPETGDGLANANTFVASDEATTILEGVPYADVWVGVGTDAQNRALAEASAWLSRMPWDGVRTTQTQALAWPRYGVTTRDGYALLSNLIPPFLKQATARLALWISQQGASPFADTGLAPGTELELASGMRFTPQAGVAMPPDVRGLIADYLKRGGTVRRG